MATHVSMLVTLSFLILSGNVEVISLNPNFESCEPKNCGKGPTISFPFYIKNKQGSYCGYPNLGLLCAPNGYPIVNLSSNTFYTIHQIFYHNYSLRVSNPNFSNSPNCLPQSQNLTLNFPFSLVPNQREVRLFFDCEPNSELKENTVGCYEGNRSRSVLGVVVDEEEEKEKEKLKYASDNCRGGKMVTTVVESTEGGMRDALGRGFMLKAVKWRTKLCDECQRSGGRCNFSFGSTSSFAFTCICRDLDSFPNCSSPALNGSLLPIGAFSLSSKPKLD